MEKKKKLAKPLFTLAVIFIAIAGLGNLALSQIHIATITKVFASEIGFYFFLFIIFGLVCFMNVLNMKKKTENSGNSILMGIFGVLASGAGFLYVRLLLADIELGKLLEFKDIKLTLFIVSISSIVYFVGSLIAILTHKAAKQVM